MEAGHETDQLAEQTTQTTHSRARPHPRPQTNARHIQTSLRLTETLYQEFYELVESILIKRGWITHTFRSRSDKKAARDDYAKVVTDEITTLGGFADTVDSLATVKGRTAFRYLVYKINSNYRRRLQRLSRNRSLCSDATQPCTSPDNSSSGAYSPLPFVRHRGIPPEAGIYAGRIGKPLTLLCCIADLARTNYQLTCTGKLHAERLSYARFIVLLETDR
jgi:hypothetical protein